MLCRFEDCAKSIPLDVVDVFEAYTIKREIDSTRGKERKGPRDLFLYGWKKCQKQRSTQAKKTESGTSTTFTSKSFLISTTNAVSTGPTYVPKVIRH